MQPQGDHRGLLTRWEHDLHHRASERTVVEPSLVVAPERYTKLSRLSPHDGSVLWTSNVHRPWGWLAADGAVCAYLNQHSFLQCFDTVSGVERWAVELSGRQGAIFGRLLVAGDVVITGGWRGYTDLIAVCVRDGTVRWSMPTRNRNLLAPVSGPDGTVWLAFPDERRAWLVEAATGDRIAELPCPTRDDLPEAAPCAVWTGSRFICADADGRVVAIDRDGRTHEVARHGTRIRSSVPFVADDLIAFEDDQGCLATYSLTTGSRLWQAAIHHRRRDILPMARLTSGRLAVGTAFGQLLVFDEDGGVIDKRTFGKHFHAGLAATAAGTILGAVDGRLISVELEPVRRGAGPRARD